MNFKEILKEKKNIFLILILIFALIIRIKYLAINSAVWWDEAEYLNAAKHLVFNTPYDISPQRQPLFPLLISFFYFIGISNLPLLKFFTVTIPSILSIYAIYLLGKEMYNKKIGLIASLIMSSFWISLFWTSRFSTDGVGFMFGVFAFYFFWKGYINEEKKKKNLIIMGLFLGLGFLTRVGNILPVIIILVFLIITKRFTPLKDKNLWIAGAITILTIVPYLIWNYINFKNPLVFYIGYFGASKAALKLAAPIAWHLMSLFEIYPLWFLFIFFLIGLITLFNVFIGFDMILKNQNKELIADFFLIIMIIIPMAFFIFIERQAEPRWALIISPAIFFITGKGILLVSDRLEKFNKKIAIISIFLILLIGVYTHITYANDQIIAKKDSYVQFKEAGVWLKEHTLPNEAIYNNGEPQNIFYTERKTLAIGGGTPEQFEEMIKKENAKYIVISLLEIEPNFLSIEEFGPQGLQKWSLPYFESELILENGQAKATFRNKPINEFPPQIVEKESFTFELVYQIPGLFIYGVKPKN